MTLPSGQRITAASPWPMCRNVIDMGGLAQSAGGPAMVAIERTYAADHRDARVAEWREPFVLRPPWMSEAAADRNGPRRPRSHGHEAHPDHLLPRGGGGPERQPRRCSSP